jgi:thymidylate kinase
MLITFSGLDGAGKSTLIHALKIFLEERKKQVTIMHMTRQVGLYAYARSVRDHFARRRADGSGQTTGHVERATSVEEDRYRHVGPGWLKGVMLGLVRSPGAHGWAYLVDLLIFLLYRLYIEKVKHQVLLMDRYFYDTLAYEVADGRRWLLIHLLTRLTPTPQLPVLVDVSPEVAYARKGEHSVDFLRRRRGIYLHMLSRVKGSIVLPNEDLDASTSALRKAVIERLDAT